MESRERELLRREREGDMRAAEVIATAREEARASVELELDSLMREKASLMIERKRFEEERTGDAAMRSAIADMRQRHREMEEGLVEKQQEIDSLKAALARVHNSLSAEDRDVSEASLSFFRPMSPSLTSPSFFSSWRDLD
jgi:chromosome segregation ATPase